MRGFLNCAGFHLCRNPALCLPPIPFRRITRSFYTEIRQNYSADAIVHFIALPVELQ